MTALSPTALDHAHYVRLNMVASVPAGTTLETVTQPSYWSNHAQRLKRGSIIEVLSEDNELDVQLRVLEVGQTYAKMRVLAVHSEPKAAKAKKPAASEEAVEVNYGGKADRWRVIHKGAVVSSGHETKSAAEQAAVDYQSKLAA